MTPLTTGVTTGTLAARGLRVVLGGRAVLDGVDAVLEPGRVTAIVGPNGAGKSTLLSCLAGLRRPDDGTVHLAQDAVGRLGGRRRAQAIGFIPQTPEVAWTVRVRTLVALGRTPYVGPFGLAPEDDPAVARALAVTGTEGFADRIVETLSGGERARVLIARALAGEPEWVLADEPLAGLDPGHQLDAAALFRTLADEGRGVVVTLHDLPMAVRMADRVLVLAHGRVLADAAPSEALTPGVLAAAYGIEARWIEGAGRPLIEIVGRHAGSAHG